MLIKIKAKITNNILLTSKSKKLVNILFNGDLLNEENRIFLGITESASYPIHEYSPDVEFPEYPFGSDTLSSDNQVYSLIREGFYCLGYDLANYGTQEWNPLGEIIKKEDTVLVKPNWVMHYNKDKNNKDNMECLVTHPSIVRAVIDNILIALGNTGKVIVADAPMQGCDLNGLFLKAGYLELFKFYTRKGVKIEFKDLREYRVITKKGVITQTLTINDQDESVIIDLEENSSHTKNNEMNRFKVSDYTTDRTKDYHNINTHKYSINKTVLSSDVIINIPKPKCHRLAGLTAAQKNLVGIVFDKSCLPHRKIGSPIEGGDEYKNKSNLKKLISIIEEKKLKVASNAKLAPAFLLQIAIVILHYTAKILSKDKYMIGSWYGNDTIWRTVADLNYLIRYADKNGKLCNTTQRKILNISDMIVSGQGNGPIGPTPKYLGIILIGEDSSYMDTVCSKIMGFNTEKIPGLIETTKNPKLSCLGVKKIYSNNVKHNDVNYEDFNPDVDWKFEPHQMWKGHIENDS